MFGADQDRRASNQQGGLEALRERLKLKLSTLVPLWPKTVSTFAKRLDEAAEPTLDESQSQI